MYALVSNKSSSFDGISKSSSFDGISKSSSFDRISKSSSFDRISKSSSFDGISKSSSFDRISKSSSFDRISKSNSFDGGKFCNVVKVISLNSVIVRYGYFKNKRFILTDVIESVNIEEHLYKYILHQIKEYIESKTFLAIETRYNTLSLYKDGHYVNNLINNIIFYNLALYK
jgi:hypothetical protein